GTGKSLGIDYGTKWGYEVGADVKVPLGNVGQNLSVSFRPGLLFSTGGGTIEFPARGTTQGSTTRIVETLNLNSLEVPLLLELKPATLLDGRIRILGGPQVTTIVGAQAVIGNTSTDIVSEVNRVSMTATIGGLVKVGNKLDFGMLANIPL